MLTDAERNRLCAKGGKNLTEAEKLILLNEAHELLAHAYELLQEIEQRLIKKKLTVEERAQAS